MLTISANTRLFFCQTPVKMHKSFEGLSAIIEKMFPGELLSGAFFIFLNRTRTYIKVLYCDGDGLVIFYKRLEKGSFVTKKNSSSTLSRREFLMLLEGVTSKHLQPRFSL